MTSSAGASSPERRPGLDELRAIVGRDQTGFSVARACLQIARAEYPDLDVANCLGQLDRLAATCTRVDPGEGADIRDRLAAINRVLFEEEGFHGPGRDHGSDPRSSYLNAVLKRRTGLPVMLSVIYLEVAGRVGIDMVGVGMPAHFIVRVAGVSPALFVDPFHAGAILDEDGCGRLLSRVTGGRLELQPEYLMPTPRRRIIERILHNLKAVYLHGDDLRHARRIIDAILILQPENAEEIRDRGVLAYRSLLFAEALTDLERYLELAPRAQDATAMRSYVQTLHRLLPSSN
ncbi:MAG: SirB1 family protein [Acidobacteriota bacterium]